MVKDNKAFVNRQKRREGMLAESANIEIIWKVMSRSKQRKIDSLVNQNNITRINLPSFLLHWAILDELSSILGDVWDFWYFLITLGVCLVFGAGLDSGCCNWYMPGYDPGKHPVLLGIG